MTRQEAREKCLVDPFYLSKVLGYDFYLTRDVHEDLFAAFTPKDSTKPLRDWSGTKNRLILWSRGHMKSSAAVVDIVQTILNAPDIRILVMQSTLKLTKGWVKEIKSHFDGSNPKSQLRRLFPEFCGERIGAAEHFTVPARQRMHLKEATVTAASPKAVSTGQHYDVFYADDLVTAVNFRNVELLDKLESEFSHFIPLIDPGGYTIVTGTRYSHADLYARIIKRNQGEWFTSIRTCYKPDGSLLFPQRETEDGRKIGFTDEILATLKRDDPETFSAQYLNQILSTKHQIFPRDVLFGAVRSSKDGDYPELAPAFLMVDLAESRKSESDHSVIVVGKRDPRGRVWIVDVIGGSYSTAQLANVILQQTLKHRPWRVYIEKSPGSTFFADYLASTGRERNVAIPVELVKCERHKDAKFIRISSLESLFRNKKLLLCAGINDFERLEEEFTQFPRGRHDDRPDAIALLVKQLSQNVTSTRALSPADVLAVRPIRNFFDLVRQEPVETPTKKTSLLGDAWV